MSVNFATLAQQFYRFAQVKDLFGQFDWMKDKLELEKSYNSITPDSTGFLISQELQGLEISEEEIKNIVDLSVVIHDQLSDFAENAKKSLKESYLQFLHLPPEELISNLKLFIPLIRKYNKHFSSPEILKFIQAVKDCALLQVEIKNKQEVDVVKYARLVYMPENEIFEILKENLNSIIFRLKTTASTIANNVEHHFALTYFKLMRKNKIFGQREKEFRSIYPSVEKKLIKIVEDYDNFDMAIFEIEKMLISGFKLSSDVIKNSENWKDLEYHLHNLYKSKIYSDLAEFKDNLKLLVEKKLIKIYSLPLGL